LAVDVGLALGLLLLVEHGALYVGQLLGGLLLFLGFLLLIGEVFAIWLHLQRLRSGLLVSFRVFRVDFFSWIILGCLLLILPSSEVLLLLLLLFAAVLHFSFFIDFLEHLGLALGQQHRLLLFLPLLLLESSLLGLLSLHFFDLLQLLLLVLDDSLFFGLYSIGLPRIIKPVRLHHFLLGSQQDAPAEVLAHVDQVVRSNMDVSPLFVDFVSFMNLLLFFLRDYFDPVLLRLSELFRAEEGALQSVRVLDAELLEQHNTSCRVLLFLDGHLALSVAEDGAVVSHVVGDARYYLVGHPHRRFVAVVLAGIHEHVHVPTVAMEIATEDHPSRVGVGLLRQSMVEPYE